MERRWINVKDRMPPCGQEVLLPQVAPFDAASVGHFNYDSKHWHIDRGCQDGLGYDFDYEEITHWMPLPKNPENAR